MLIRKALSRLATTVGFVMVLSSVSLARQFLDVTKEAGLILKAKHSWGNPIWGDINNDGFLDLIVPTHGLLKIIKLVPFCRKLDSTEAKNDGSPASVTC